MNSDNTEKEVDVIDIGASIANLFYQMAFSLVKFGKFLKKKVIVLISIVVVGAVAGYLLDENNKKYESEVIVTANFESVDYLYNTIGLIDSKIKEKDEAYLKSIGIDDYKSVKKISIHPVIDVYDFITRNPQNFEMIKLLSESADAQTTIKDLVTSKNYAAHEITLVTTDKSISAKIIKSLLAYLNKNSFHEQLRLVTIKNIEYQLNTNQEMIDQIDEILKTFSKEKEQKQPNEKLVYYNDNMQLNDIINTRNSLVIEQGRLRVQSQFYDRFIKEKSTTLNVVDNDSIGSKLKLVLPLLGLLIFFVLSLILTLAKKAKA